jgi:small subunit ribosomal protein S4
VKQYYGLLDRQFRALFKRAERQKGHTGENLMIMLERRLDHVVYLLGWGPSHSQARQLVAHGHIFVNGDRIDRPSYLVEIDDVLTCSKADPIIKWVKANVEATKGRAVPGWFESKPELPVPEAKILRFPTREEVMIEVQEQLIVEFCSR